MVDEDKLKSRNTETLKLSSRKSAASGQTRASCRTWPFPRNSGKRPRHRPWCQAATLSPPTRQLCFVEAWMCLVTCAIALTRKPSARRPPASRILLGTSTAIPKATVPQTRLPL